MHPNSPVLRSPGLSSCWKNASSLCVHNRFIFLRYLTSKLTAVRTESSAAVVGVRVAGCCLPLVADGSPSRILCSHGLRCRASPHAAQSELSGPNTSGGNYKKGGQNHGVRWPNQNELVSAEVGAAADLYAEAAGRVWVYFSHLLAPHRILQHWKREQTRLKNTVHCLMKIARSNLQLSTRSASCWRRESWGETEGKQ